MEQRPEPFAPGDAQLWIDPRVAPQLLAAHLDPTTDAASRRPARIAQEVDWLVEALSLQPGDTVLDLGCGPGLYCEALAAHGLRVTGVDVSAHSLRHARPGARYVHADYRAFAEHDAYDAAILVYFDFGVLPDGDRSRVLANVRRALRAGGRFAFDVWSAAAVRPESSAWSEHPDGGFWRSGPHRVLERHLDYPAERLSCAEYTVLDGQTTVYRIWEHRFSRKELERLLTDAGLAVETVAADLTGTPWTSASETIAVVARR